MILFTLTYASELMHGLLITVGLTFGSLLAGLVISMGLTFCMLSSNSAAQRIAHVFVFVFRGSPLLVQIFLLYYGVSQFDWIRETWLWPIFKEPFWCAMLALSLNSSAYMTVIFHGAIQCIPTGELKVAKTLGLTQAQIFSSIQFPQALRFCWSSLTNEIILLVKATGLASTIALLDVLGVTKMLISETYQVMTGLSIAGLLYLLIVVILLSALKMIKIYMGQPS